MFWRRNGNGSQPPLDLSPQTELDSLIREFLCRIIEREGTVTLDMTAEREPGNIRWEFGASPSGAAQATIWFVPSGEGSSISPDTRKETR